MSAQTFGHHVEKVVEVPEGEFVTIHRNCTWCLKHGQPAISVRARRLVTPGGGEAGQEPVDALADAETMWFLDGAIARWWWAVGRDVFPDATGLSQLQCRREVQGWVEKRATCDWS